MGKRKSPGIPGGKEDVVRGKKTQKPPYSPPSAKKWQAEQETAEEQKEIPPEDRPPDTRSPFGGMGRKERQILAGPISKSLDENLSTIKGIFHAPRNSDLVVREFVIGGEKEGKRAALMYLEGLVGADSIREHILKPLLRAKPEDTRRGVKGLSETTISETHVQFASTFSDIASALVDGNTLLLIDGDDKGLSVCTRSIEHRAVEESPAEAVVRGPHEGFVENFSTNLALIRRRLATPQLVTERHRVGARSHSPYAIMYLEGVVNPKLVDEARRRLSCIKTDVVTSASLTSQYLQDTPNDPFPTVIITERPDKVASMLSEGHVAIITNSPGVLLVPTTLWSLMHSSEDHYIHWIPATFLAGIRWFALFATIYTSGLYVAITTYHPEMIPTELLLAMAGSREVVPFPAVFEILIMELGFELIREAGVRIPMVIGPTVGIVGAVILGQAAVAASIVSPILVVLVAASGLASFAIPNYDLGFYARIMKFVMLGVAAVLGIPGLTIASVLLATRIFSLRSFGVPVTSPVIPRWPHSRDIIARGPVTGMQRRPGYTRPLDSRRRPPKKEQSSPVPTQGPKERQDDERQ